MQRLCLPNGINARDAVALPFTFLSAWIGLVSRASISASSTVLVHDGTSGEPKAYLTWSWLTSHFVAAGSAAVQVAK